MTEGTSAPTPMQAPDYAESGLVFALPLGGPDEALAWIKNANHGDKVVYFVGHLAVARDHEGVPFGGPKARRADAVGTIMSKASDAKWVQLTQQRVADGCFLYVARRTVH